MNTKSILFFNLKYNIYIYIIKYLTVILCSPKSFVNSATGYYAFATAKPYPGTIIIYLELTIISVALSVLISVWVPSIFDVIADGFKSYPPNITLTIDLFIALHIIYDKIAPLDPTKAPTIVSSGLFNINPSAHNAHPEYEFNTVITTGISAPPIAFVNVTPKALLNTIAEIIDNDAKLKLSVVAKTPRAANEAIAIPMLIWLCAGKTVALLSINPYNLANATIEPVKVTPPVKTPKNTANLCTNAYGSWANSGKWCIQLPTDVRTAAKPTKLWKHATNYGRSVIATLYAIVPPIVPPIPTIAIH